MGVVAEIRPFLPQLRPFSAIFCQLYPQLFILFSESNRHKKSSTMKKSKASKEATIDITSPQPVVLGEASSSVTLQQVDPLNPPKLRKSSRLQSDKSDTDSIGSSPQVKIIEPVPSKTTSKSSSSYVPPSAEELRDRIDPITCLEKLRELLKNNPPNNLPQEAEGYQGYSTESDPFTELQIKTTWNGFHLHPSSRDVTRAISKLPKIYQAPKGKKKSRNSYVSNSTLIKTDVIAAFTAVF